MGFKLLTSAIYIVVNSQGHALKEKGFEVRAPNLKKKKKYLSLFFKILQSEKSNFLEIIQQR